MISNSPLAIADGGDRKGGDFRFGSFATRSSQRQVRVLSAMPPEAEVTFAAAFGTLRRPRCARRSIDRNR